MPHFNATIVLSNPTALELPNFPKLLKASALVRGVMDGRLVELSDFDDIERHQTEMQVDHLKYRECRSGSTRAFLYPRGQTFCNNGSQAIRIPVDFEMPGKRVLIRKDGDRLIIELTPWKILLEVLADLKPLGPEDEFPDVDDTLLQVEDVDL